MLYVYKITEINHPKQRVLPECHNNSTQNVFLNDAALHCGGVFSVLIVVVVLC